MNTEKIAFNKVAKIRTNLALLDDIRAEIVQANKGAMKGIDMVESAKRPLENSLKDNKELLKKLQRTKKSAIELGATDVVKELQNYERQVEENIKSIDKFLSKIY